MTEDRLIQSLKERSKGALEQLYDRYSAALYGVILRIIPDETLAEDVLQETFIKIWRKIDTYDSRKGRLFTWILNIARNTAIDTRRSKQFTKPQKTQALDNTFSNQESLSATIPIEHIGVKENVANLKIEYQKIIDLLYFQGYSQSEAAKELEIPLGTLKTRARAAIQELRKHFQV